MFDRDAKILLERYSSIYNPLLVESVKNRINKYRITDPYLINFIFRYENTVPWVKIKTLEDLNTFIRDVLIKMIMDRTDREQMSSNAKTLYCTKINWKRQVEILQNAASGGNQDAIASLQVFKNNPEGAKEMLSKQVNDSKEASFNTWNNYILNDNDVYKEHPAFQFLILNSVFSSTDNTSTAEITPLNQKVVADIFDSIAANPAMQNNVHQLYVDGVIEDAQNTELKKITSGNGEWIKIPSKKNDPDNYEENLKSLMSLAAGTNWCIAGFQMANSYLSEGDFYIYFLEQEGKKQGVAAIRMRGNTIAEIRGILAEQELEDKYIDNVLDLIKAENLKGGVEYVEKLQEQKVEAKRRIALDKMLNNEPLDEDEQKWSGFLDEFNKGDHLDKIAAIAWYRPQPSDRIKKIISDNIDISIHQDSVGDIGGYLWPRLLKIHTDTNSSIVTEMFFDKLFDYIEKDIHKHVSSKTRGMLMLKMIFDRHIVRQLMDATFGEEASEKFASIWKILKIHNKPSEVIEAIFPMFDVEIYDPSNGKFLYETAFEVIHRELELNGYYKTNICLDRFLQQKPNIDGESINRILYTLANTSVSRNLEDNFREDDMLASSSLITSGNGLIGSGVVDRFAWNLYAGFVGFEDMPEYIGRKLVDLALFSTERYAPEFFVKLPINEMTRWYSIEKIFDIAIKLLNIDNPDVRFYSRFALDCLNLKQKIKDTNLLYELMFRILVFTNVSENKEIIKREIPDMEDFKNFLRNKEDRGESMIRRMNKYMFGIPYPEESKLQSALFDNPTPHHGELNDDPIFENQESKIVDLFKSFLLRS